MTRVSQLELYNDKDVITQICMMKQMVETGTYKDVDVQDDGAGNLVFTFTDQQDDTEVFTIPVKLISSVTSSQTGSTVTMRITWTDGTHDDYTWTAGGDVTTDTDQTITAIKTFNQSPIIPDTPSGTHAAVNLTYVSKTDGTNNMLHTSGTETAAGDKTWTGKSTFNRPLRRQTISGFIDMNSAGASAPANQLYEDVLDFYGVNADGEFTTRPLIIIEAIQYPTTGQLKIRMKISNASDAGYTSTIIAEGGL